MENKEYTINLTEQELHFLLSATRNFRGQIHKLRLPEFSINNLNILIEKAEKIFFEIRDAEQKEIQNRSD
jgi:cell division protein ZapA (FtsZ GTPase activity inhibitor)